MTLKPWFGNPDAVRGMVGTANVWPESCICNNYHRKTGKAMQARDEEPFAKGQKGCDLRVCSDAKDLKTQLMEAIDSADGLFRFLEISTRVMAENQRRSY